MGNDIQYLVINYNEKESTYACVCIAESLDCTLETITTWSINYISIKKKFNYKKTANFIAFCISSKGLCGATICKDFPGSPGDKEPTCQCRRRKRLGFHPWVGKIPWRRGWQPTSVLLPGESHGQRSLLGCRPRGRKDSDMTGATRHAGTSGGRTPGWPTSYPDNGVSELYRSGGHHPTPRPAPSSWAPLPSGPGELRWMW